MNFKTFLKLFLRIFRQRPIKTFRTIYSKEILVGTIWLEANKVSINY
jgi:hypothetical protein